MITPFLMLASVLVFLLYLGHMDHVLAIRHWVIWTGDRQAKAAVNNKYRAKLVRRIDATLKRLGLKDGTRLPPYRLSYLRSTRITISIIIQAAVVALLLLGGLVHDPFIRHLYRTLIIALPCLAAFFSLVALGLYLRAKSQIKSYKALKCLEFKVHLLALNKSHVEEMEQTLKLLTDICPEAFKQDLIAYSLDQAHCLAKIGRCEEALNVVRSAKIRFQDEKQGEGAITGLDELYRSPLMMCTSDDISLKDIEIKELAMCICTRRIAEAKAVLHSIRSRPSLYGMEAPQITLYAGALALLEGNLELAYSCVLKTLRENSQWIEAVLDLMVNEPGLEGLAHLLRHRRS